MADLFADRLEASLANLTRGEAADYDRDAHDGFGKRVDVPPARRFVGLRRLPEGASTAASTW